MPGIIVAEALRRNRNITRTTRAVVSINSNSASSTDARMVVVRSEMIRALDPVGQGILDLGEERLHRIHHANDVGAGLPLNIQYDGLVGIDPEPRAWCFPRRR